MGKTITQENIIETLKDFTREHPAAYDTVFAFASELIGLDKKDLIEQTFIKEPEIASSKEEILKEISLAIREELAGERMIDDPSGSSYYILKTYTAEDAIDLRLIVNACKYRNDDKTYYGIYSVVEIDGGDNICDSDWEYTNDCKLSSLRKVLSDIYDAWTDTVFAQQYVEISA